VTNLSLRLLVLVGAALLAAAALLDARPASASVSRVAVLTQIDDYRDQTWHWQQLMGARRTPTTYAERTARSAAYRVWLRDLWRKRAHAAERRASHPPHRAAWQCIHRYERHPHQGWRTRTGNGYYGGLQMDLAFQRAYGGRLLRTKGTADRWSPLEQMWVAERAYRSGRGFYPWPNTARYCGLI
jgi:Transglycosylase-like domain